MPIEKSLSRHYNTPCWRISAENMSVGLNAEVVEAIRQGSYKLRPVVQRRIARRDQERWHFIFGFLDFVKFHFYLSFEWFNFSVTGTPLLPQSLPGEPRWAMMMRMKKKRSRHISSIDIWLPPMTLFCQKLIVELFLPSQSPPSWRLMMLSPLRPTCSPKLIKYISYEGF